MFGFMRRKEEPEAAHQNPPAEEKQPPNPARRTTSEPPVTAAAKPKAASKGLDDDDDWGRPPPKRPTKKDKEKFKNDFSDSGGLENQSVQDLENYAVYKAEETTDTVNNCKKIAEDIRGDAAKTLDMLHEQGEQIHRTQETTVEIDKDLSKGEKLLGNLGGMFSAPWKPKKTKKIKGPQDHKDKASKKASKEQKKKLFEKDKGKHAHSAPATPANEPVNANYAQIEAEKQKQDDGLSDLSDILGDLKGMAVDMGGELDKQNKALDTLGEDVDELNSRVKGANQRARKLIAK